MNRTIKRTVTITITETWTIVWTAADDPVPPAPVTAAEAPKRAGEVPAALQANLNNTLPDQPTKRPCPENTPLAPRAMVQPPDELSVSPAADRRRKRGRRRRTKDEQNRPAEETDNDDT